METKTAYTKRFCAYLHKHVVYFLITPYCSNTGKKSIHNSICITF